MRQRKHVLRRTLLVFALTFVIPRVSAIASHSEPIEQAKPTEIRFYYASFPREGTPERVQRFVDYALRRFPALGDADAGGRLERWDWKADPPASVIPVVFLPDWRVFVDRGGKAVAALISKESRGYIQPQSLATDPNAEGYGIYYRADPGKGPTKAPPMATETVLSKESRRELDRSIRPNRFVGYRLAVNNLDWSGSTFDERGEGEFRGRVWVYPLYDGVWLALREEFNWKSERRSDRKSLRREVVFPLLDANGEARDPANDPYTKIRNGPYQSVILSDLGLDDWATHSELIIPEPFDQKSHRTVFHESIAIPSRLQNMDPPVFAFTKLESWRPGAEDLRFQHHPRPGDLDNLRMVVIFGNISTEDLKEAIGSIVAR